MSRILQSYVLESPVVTAEQSHSQVRKPLAVGQHQGTSSTKGWLGAEQ